MIIDLCPKSNEEMKKREEAVENVVSEFKKTSLDKITDINAQTMIDEGGINPYLAISLDMRTIEEVVEFFFNRKVERSLGTSFGTVLEKFIMSIFDGVSGKDMDDDCKKRSKPWVCWWDVAIKKGFLEEGIKYKGLLMAVKSGPSTMNADTVNTFISKAEVAEKNDYRPLLIFAYGKEASGVIKGTLKKKGYPANKYVRVGMEIFGEFFDNPEYYLNSLELFSVGEDVDLFETIKSQKIKVLLEMNKKYSSVEELFEDTFEKKN